MTSNYISFRAAVSLNNMGVCTMEHGHFGAALETLKDSLYIMKNIILNQPVSERSTNSLEGFGQEDVLQAARMRLVQAQTQPLVNDFLDIQPCDDCNVTALKIPIIQAAKYGPPSSTVFIPIRLGSSSHQLPSLEDDDDNQLELQEQIYKIPSAVILYNFGLTHMLAHLQNKKSLKMTMTASVPKRTPTERPHESSLPHESLLHGGIVCFTMAHGILCQERGATVCSEEGQQERQQQHAVSFEMLQAMLISGLVLRNLFFMLRMNHQVRAAQDVLQSLSSLLYIIQVHEDVLRNMNVELENCKTACAA
jgi:hypothetical protein